MAARRQRGALELRDGVWWVRIRRTRTTPNGSALERPRLELGPVSRLRTRAAARLAADRLLADMGVVRSGRIVAFDDFAELYERDCLAALQKSTRKAQRSRLRKHLVPYLKKTPLQDIQAAAPAVVIARMLSAHLSRATIAATVGLLATMLQKAGQWGYEVSTVDRKAFKLPPAGVPKERRCLTPAESDRIIQASDWPHRAMYALLAYEGLRCSEVLALEWRHINLATATLSIRQATTHGELKITKSNNSATDLPMLPELLQILQAYHAHQVAAGEGTGLLFRNSAGRPLLADDVRYRHFRPLLKRLGIPHAGLHAFRHGLATNLFATGASAPVVRSAMRHGDIRTTLGYTHVSSEDVRLALLAGSELIRQTRTVDASEVAPNGPPADAPAQ